MSSEERELIIKTFKENDSFVDYLILDASKYAMTNIIPTILSVKNECRNNNITDITTLFINSYNKYLLHIINDKFSINKQPINDNQNENQSVNNNQQVNNHENDNHPVNETEQSNTNNIDYDYESGHKYSSTYAQSEINKKINDLFKQENSMKENVLNGENIAKKKDYIDYENIISSKNNLESITNIQSHFINDKGIEKRDNKIDNYQKLMNKTTKQINKTKYKFIKVSLQGRLKRLQEKQGKIKEKQRKIIDKKIVEFYKKNLKENKAINKSKALTEYYKMREDLLKIKREENLVNVTNDKKITNLFYKFKNIPVDLALLHVETNQKEIEKKKNKYSSIDTNHLYNQMLEKKSQTQGKGMAA